MPDYEVKVFVTVSSRSKKQAVDIVSELAHMMDTEGLEGPLETCVVQVETAGVVKLPKEAL